MGTITPTIDGSPGLVQTLRRIQEVTEAAAVDSTTICNGLLDLNEADHRARITTEAIPTLHSLHPTILNIQATTRANLHKMKRTSLDLPRIAKWRIGRRPGPLKVHTTKVILQLRTPNSALLSSPKLLSRPQLKLLQISTPRPNSHPPGLRTTGLHQHVQGIKIISTREMTKTFLDRQIEDLRMIKTLHLTITARKRYHKTENIPTTVQLRKTNTTDLAHARLQRRNSNLNLALARSFLPNWQPPNRYTTASQAMNPLLVPAPTAKSSKPSTSTPATKSPSRRSEWKASAMASPLLLCERSGCCSTSATNMWWLCRKSWLRRTRHTWSSSTSVTT